MRALVVCALIVAWAAPGRAQTPLLGTVHEQSGDSIGTPVVGANVYWLGTGSGTTTDADGAFHLPMSTSTHRLVVSAVGYQADTMTVEGAGPVRVALLAAARQVADVEVVGERAPTFLDYMNPAGVRVMTEQELTKAACCNLSESFETNPSIDVSFTDAITGTRQIEMLGLAGTYTQTTIENMPAIRGLTSNAGLTYIPGPWVESIQVAKGIGSVANGYESITGQINVELRKADDVNEQSVFVNAFADQDARLEANLHYREQLGEDWSSMTMLHLATRQRAVDANADRFLDSPLSNTLNVLQRFRFSAGNGLEGQVNLQYVDDEKKGGTLRGVGMSRTELSAEPLEYGFASRSHQWRVAGKTGYVFPADEHRSVGLQWLLTDYRQNSWFGPREYAGSELTGYLNLLYETELGSAGQKMRAGGSFLFDNFDESFAGRVHRRIERVPGVFAEYTYAPDEQLSVVAGLRADYHNLFGGFVTPRLHVRFAPAADWVLRAVGGRGQRAANVLTENLAYLASVRSFEGPMTDQQYPFDPEVAWNLGFSVTRYFSLGGREGSVIADLHHTVFDRQVVVDLDRSPQTVVFRNLDGRSFSNSIQVEVNVTPLDRLDTRVAYRYLDVRQSVTGGLRQRPFVARHRAFMNLAYATDRADPDDPRMLYDLTLQWFGPKRLPDSESNPEDFRAVSQSPDFMLMNAQVTREFSWGFNLYLGIENVLNFRQEGPIIDPDHPNGPYFDSSYIWGPVVGRMVYLGLRWRP